MSAQNAVRVVHIRGTSEGLNELEQDLRAVSDAQDNLAKTSETTARTTETTSRRQMSAAGAYDRLRAQIDQQYRAQRQLERGQQTLDRAFQQGLATQQEYDRAMAQLQERFHQSVAANDNATRAAERRTIALRDMAEAERLAASASDGQSRFNSLLGVNDNNAGSARDSAAVFQEAAREAEAFDARVAALRAQIDPLGTAQARLNAELAEYAEMAARGAITSDELGRAQDMAKGRFDEATASTQNATTWTDRLRESVSRLVLAYVSIQGVRMLGGMADEWSEIQARVVNATGSFEGGQAVLERLGEMARRTYSDLNQTAESWLSSSTSLTALGVSISDQLDLVESFNNALVISATRGQRAESVQRAWSDALSVGKMNMQQFNTIMTGSDRLAQALADSMGVNVLELQKMAREGKVTRQEMLGLSSELGTLREEADRMPATIADGMTLIRNSLLMTIGMMDQAGGASESFAAGLVIIADNMQRIVTYAGTAVTAYGVYYVGAMVAARVATMGLTGALALLRTALIRLGIGALVVAAGELIYQFTRLSTAAGGFGEAMALLGDVASEVWDRIKLDGQSLVLDLQSVWESIKAGFLSMIAAMQKRWAEFLYFMADSAPTASMAKTLEDAGMKAGSAYLETERAAAAAREEAERLGAAARAAAEKSRAPLESIAALRKALADAGSGDLPGGGGGGTLPTEIDSKAAEKAKRLEEAYERLTSRAHDFVTAQQMEASVIGMSEQAANALRYEFDLLNEARRAGITLTDADRAGFKALAEAMSEAEERTRFLKDAFDFTQKTVKGFFADLRSGIDEGKSFWDAFADAGVNALNKIADKLIEMAMDQMINNVLRNLMGAFGGGFSIGSSSPMLAFAQTGGYLMDSGGTLLGDNVIPFGPKTRRLGNGMIADSGFGPRHFPVVLEQGETVLTERDTRRTMDTINGLASSQSHANQNGASVNVRVQVENNSGAQVEVGEPRQEGGEMVIPMIINELKREIVSDIASNGPVSRSMQGSFVGLQRRTR